MFHKTANALYKKDLILNFLYEKLYMRFGAFKTTLVLFMVPVIGSLVIGYYEGTLYNTPNLIGVIKDYTLYSLWAVILFSLYFYYHFCHRANSFFSLQLDEILNKKNYSKDKADKIDSKLELILAPIGIYKVIYFILIFLFIFFWFTNLVKGFDPVRYYGKDIWHSANHIIGMIYLKTFNLLYVGIFMAVFFFRFFVSIIAFSLLFTDIARNNGFIIKPLSPDNSAGLKILSDLSIYFMYMVLPFFLIFISLILRGSTLLMGQQVGFIALIFMLFVTFFLPLGSVHSAMKSAKKKELSFISRHFAELNKEVKEDITKQTFGEEFNQKVESLEKIDFLYEKTDKMPVWPFNMANIGRLIISALIPFAIFLFDQLTNPESFLYNLDKLPIIRFFQN